MIYKTPSGPAILVRTEDRGKGLEQDRKSTRLNSSHRTISYAVFCLKKKKKKYIQSSRKYYISYFKTQFNTTMEENSSIWMYDFFLHYSVLLRLHVRDSFSSEFTCQD